MKSRTMGNKVSGKGKGNGNGVIDKKDLIDQKIRDSESRFKLSKDTNEKVFKRGLADAFQGVDTYIESDH